MEMMSEQERYENQLLSHDIFISPEQLALQALIDKLSEKRNDHE